MLLVTEQQIVVVGYILALPEGNVSDFLCVFLCRLFEVYPQTKTYFAHWSDLTPGSAQVRKHGSTIVKKIGEAISHIDDLTGALSALSDLHAFKLRVDPANFKVRYRLCIRIRFAFNWTQFCVAIMPLKKLKHLFVLLHHSSWPRPSR